jgi:hypothetical protein
MTDFIISYIDNILPINKFNTLLSCLLYHVQRLLRRCKQEVTSTSLGNSVSGSTLYILLLTM